MELESWPNAGERLSTSANESDTAVSVSISLVWLATLLVQWSISCNCLKKCFFWVWAYLDDMLLLHWGQCCLVKYWSVCYGIGLQADKKRKCLNVYYQTGMCSLFLHVQNISLPSYFLYLNTHTHTKSKHVSVLMTVCQDHGRFWHICNYSFDYHPWLCDGALLT